jgi:hypothetical protein
MHRASPPTQFVSAILFISYCNRVFSNDMCFVIYLFIDSYKIKLTIYKSISLFLLSLKKDCHSMTREP